jgi:hypothetical protein
VLARGPQNGLWVASVVLNAANLHPLFAWASGLSAFALQRSNVNMSKLYIDAVCRSNEPAWNVAAPLGFEAASVPTVSPSPV